MFEVKEKNLESAIETVFIQKPPVVGDNGAFTQGGYYKRTMDDYDREACLIYSDTLDFIVATQPKEWEKFAQQYGSDAKAKFVQRLKHEVETRGTLDILRKGIRANGCRFDLAYFKPRSGLNPDLKKMYDANIFSELRQFYFSQKTNQSIDMALFINGLSIFTIELKEEFTGQTVEDAVKEYRGRDPKEPIFLFGRCLAHFAVDPKLVYITTHVKGPSTTFLPFNKGYNRGAGNPPNMNGFATSYLWESVLARDSVLDLIQNFAQIVEEEDDKGRKTGKKSLIFPRYHQLDSVRRLLADAKESGPGKNYLIEHSAGSGKSNSIAWLSHQLVSLHKDNARVFDSIIIITDRVVLDRQLQKTVSQFEQTIGVVQNIDKNSGQLKEALEGGKNIIVTTLQKFPVILNRIHELPGRHFAVIIDEAHSSQGGESVTKMKAVLAAKSLQEAQKLDAAEDEDYQDRILNFMKKRGRMPNVSFFAFTATPKAKTLEMFGLKTQDGQYEPFSLYSMKQAIDEHFILDVLENYTTYTEYFSLLKKIEDDPRYDKIKAEYLLKSFVGLHEHTIQKKIAIMLDHFVEHSMPQINGKAKAMIVTRSRLHAVKYKQVVDEYIKKKGYSFKALVAFSDEVDDGLKKYTEAGMNGFPESQTAENFKHDEYKLLIVANKFQTGFDQPLLQTMYVDKKLGGVGAVQTLSRLNRMAPGKISTMVLDFANEADEIEKAFKPYYEKTWLKEGTDPNLLYDYHTRLMDFHLFTGEDVEAFAKIFFGAKPSQDKLHAVLDPIVNRFKEKHEDEQEDFYREMNGYVRLYAFLSQVITFTDADLEKLYQFGRLLLRKIHMPKGKLPVEIQNNIDIDSYRVQKTASGKIKLERGGGELEPRADNGMKFVKVEDMEPLSFIIREINQRFGTDFSEKDRFFIQELENKLDTNPSLESSIKVNDPENVKLTFDLVAGSLVQDMCETNFKFYKHINDDEDFQKFFFNFLFDRFYKRAKDEKK